ncbi:MAG: DinB family protein [Terriglobia bacterium]
MSPKTSGHRKELAGNPKQENDKTARKHLLELLSGGGAHVEFDKAVAGWPAKLQGTKPSGAPHTAWQLLEHLRIAQWDILEFSRNPKHVSPNWTSGYWPATEAPPNAQAWNNSARAFRRDLDAMKRLVANPSTDLFAPIPHGDGQTVFREALLVADHNAYHIGQLVLVRRMLGAWKK